MATMRDVAEKAGVSVTSVSHVVNETRPVSDELRARVIAAMRELGYRPNRLARGLRRGETFTLGLIMPDIASPFFCEMARCIEDAGFERGYSVLLCNSDQRLDKELAYARSLVEAQADGILYIAASPSTEAVELVLANGIAVVVMGRELPGLALDSVVLDNVAGGRMATQHLVQLGHRRIACVGSRSNGEPFGGRVEGYRQALAAEGASVAGPLVVQGILRGRGEYDGIRELLSGRDRPTALFACNDKRAIYALKVAPSLGVWVPSDLSIVGFDDISMASLTRPALTTLAQPRKEMGEMAVSMLLERIQDPDLPPRSKVLAPKLVVRESTAPAKGGLARD
jgi:LacI family transcriptional regulator